MLRLALAGTLRLCVSAALLVEYAEVLSHQKFSLDPERVRRSLAQIRVESRMVSPRSLAVCSDPDDNRFLECATAARAGYLVTGNKRHFPKRWRGTKVVSTREFLEIIGSDLLSVKKS